MKISDMLAARQRAQQTNRPRRAAGSRANGARRRSGGTGLSAADKSQLREAIALMQRAIDTLRELLDADETQGAVEQSWTHAPLH